MKLKFYKNVKFEDKIIPNKIFQIYEESFDANVFLYR